MRIEHDMTGPLSVNTYLVIDEETKKAFLVDPGGWSKRLAKSIESGAASLEYIILTHSHGDHIGGEEDFLEAFPDTKLVCARAEKELIEDLDKSFASQFGIDEPLKPDVYVEDGDTLAVGAMTVTMIHTPGHTPGGLCILAGDCLFSGDTLFAQSIGRTDFPGGSFAALKKAVHEKLFTLPDDTKVYPGHMGETTIGFEKRHNPFV